MSSVSLESELVRKGMVMSGNIERVKPHQGSLHLFMAGVKGHKRPKCLFANWSVKTIITDYYDENYEWSVEVMTDQKETECEANDDQSVEND